jgi:hypothetical protein
MLHKPLNKQLILPFQHVQILRGFTDNTQCHLERSKIQPSRTFVSCIPRTQINEFLEPSMSTSRQPRMITTQPPAPENLYRKHRDAYVAP